MLNTYHWSQNLQGLENNIVDCVLKKPDELEIIISPNRSPVGKAANRTNSKKPSRVVVPSNRQLSFYNAVHGPAAGIYLQPPIRSMPAIEFEDLEGKFERKESHSPSLPVLPTYHAAKEIKSEMNTAFLQERNNEQTKAIFSKEDKRSKTLGFLINKLLLFPIL